MSRPQPIPRKDGESATLRSDNDDLPPPEYGGGLPEGQTTASTPSDQFRALRAGFVDRLWLGLLLLALLGAPASVLRSIATGWLPIYTFHLGLALLIVAVFCVRQRLTLEVKSLLLIAIIWAIGLAGLFTFGILAGSYWWLVLSSLIVSMIYTIRAGVLTVMAVTFALGVAAVGFISGVLQVPPDVTVSTYSTSRVTWATLLVTTIATPFVVFHAIAAYQATTFNLLKEVQQQRDRILQLASHDRLTGLPLMDVALDRLTMALHHAKRAKSKAAVLFMDLDRFKSVNDTAGHEAGDLVLKTMADRLRNAVRLADTAARVGGDEFIVVLGGLADQGIAAQVAERIIASIGRPIDYRGQSLEVGVSVGIAVFPDHGSDTESLRRAADAAMYAAKRRGTNRVHFAE